MNFCATRMSDTKEPMLANEGVPTAYATPAPTYAMPAQPVPTAAPAQFTAPPTAQYAVPGVYAASTDPNAPPFGAPPGGRWTSEVYSGTMTFILCIVLLFVCFPAAWAPFVCPCDQRQIYMLKDGRKYTRSGAMVPPNDCCGHPCGGPEY